MNAVAVAIVFASLMSLGGCADDCPLIRQHFFVVDADADLQGLVDACRNRQAGAGETCSLAVSTAVTCGCLPLCRRLLEIADQFPGEDAVAACSLDPGMTTLDGGSQSHVDGVFVTYRPSSCP